MFEWFWSKIGWNNSLTGAVQTFVWGETTDVDQALKDAKAAFSKVKDIQDDTPGCIGPTGPTGPTGCDIPDEVAARVHLAYWRAVEQQMSERYPGANLEQVKDEISRYEISDD